MKCLLSKTPKGRIIWGAVLLACGYYSSVGAPNGLSFKKASPEVITEEACRLADSKDDEDRQFATELLDHYPLYCSPELFLSLTRKLIQDQSATVREQALAAMYNVADGRFPSASQKQQRNFLRQLTVLLESIKVGPGYDRSTIDDLLKRIKNNPLWKAPES